MAIFFDRNRRKRASVKRWIDSPEDEVYYGIKNTKEGDGSMAKAKAKYADLVQPLRLWTELVRPSYRGKMADLNLLYDKTVQPKTKIWVETFYAYAAGEGVAVPGGLQYIMEGKPMKELWEGGQHSHREYDELFLYYGSDPADNTRLGGQVEFWMGDGKDAEKYVIDEPTAFWVPKNVAHNPWIVTKVNDPKHPHHVDRDRLCTDVHSGGRGYRQLSFTSSFLHGHDREAASRKGQICQVR